MKLWRKAADLIEWNRLGLRLSKLKSAVEREAKEGRVDPKIVASKAAKGLFEGAVAVVLPALVAYLTDSTALTAALKGAQVSDAVILLAVPLIVAGARGASNWLKHRA